MVARYPEKVAAYKNGKQGLLGLFMGEVMKKSQGQVDPKVANTLLRKSLAGGPCVQESADAQVAEDNTW